MPIYNAPQDDIKFILHDVLNAEQLSELPWFEDFSGDGTIDSSSVAVYEYDNTGKKCCFFGLTIKLSWSR